MKPRPKTGTARETVAELLRGTATQLDTAAAHLRTAAGHFDGGEVPRGCAHTFAAEGHLAAVRRALEIASELHAGHALLEGSRDPGPPEAARRSSSGRRAATGRRPRPSPRT